MVTIASRCVAFLGLSSVRRLLGPSFGFEYYKRGPKRTRPRPAHLPSLPNLGASSAPWRKRLCVMCCAVLRLGQSTAALCRRPPSLCAVGSHSLSARPYHSPQPRLQHVPPLRPRPSAWSDRENLIPGAGQSKTMLLFGDQVASPPRAGTCKESLICDK